MGLSQRVSRFKKGNNSEKNAWSNLLAESFWTPRQNWIFPWKLQELPQHIKETVAFSWYFFDIICCDLEMGILSWFYRIFWAMSVGSCRWHIVWYGIEKTPPPPHPLFGKNYHKILHFFRAFLKRCSRLGQSCFQRKPWVGRSYWDGGLIPIQGSMLDQSTKKCNDQSL